MCYQLVELYSACRCLYYQHAVDRCTAYGRPEHQIQRRTILVGYSCNEHSSSTTSSGRNFGYAAYEDSRPSEPKRRDGHRLTIVGGGFNTEPNAAAASEPDRGVMWEVTRSIASARKKQDDPKADSVPDVTTEGDFDWMLPDSDQSDDSHDSDEESVVSVASSATTIDGDMVSLLFSKLLHFGDLRYLWPQLLARSSTWKRSHRTIERLLRRYSDDLHELALNETSNESITSTERTLRIRASTFVRRSRVNIAQRLCEAHYDVSEPWLVDSEHEKPEKRDSGRAPDADDSDSGAEDEPLFVLEAVDAFLFRTEPILFLQANVKALVKFRAPETTSFWERIRNRAKLGFENAFFGDEHSQSRLEHSTRLHWTCVCGRALYDDFVGLRPGALPELHSLLQSYGKDVTVDSPIEAFDLENAPEQPRDWKQTISQGFTACAQLLASAKASASLPRYRQDEQEVITTGACSRTGTGGAGSHDFVLLCIPFMRVATKLYQPEICRINSDQEFLQLLRHYYRIKRGGSSWRWLRKVKLINFVKFEMYRSHLADIRLCPSVPPPDKIGTEYAFDAGTQLDVIPPIGPNLLTHLFEHPEHADVVPTIWNRIPRKLRAELTACPTRGSSLGWGLQLAEGMEWFLFFVLGSAGFLACLLVAVVWSVARGDVQGGFSIGGFLLAFLVFCGGIAHTAVSE